VMSYLE